MLVKEEDMIKRERNDVRMVGWICNVRPEDVISAKELRTTLKMNSMRKCSQGRSLQCFGHLERMEENA